MKKIPWWKVMGWGYFLVLGIAMFGGLTALGDPPLWGSKKIGMILICVTAAMLVGLVPYAYFDFRRQSRKPAFDAE